MGFPSLSARCSMRNLLNYPVRPRQHVGGIAHHLGFPILDYRYRITRSALVPIRAHFIRLLRLHAKAKRKKHSAK